MAEFKSEKDKIQKSSGALVWGGVAAFCILLCAAPFYLKYKLDKAEAMLAAPASVYLAGNEVYDKTARSLGYGGFLGAAQIYAISHDPEALSDMEQNYKAAQIAVDKLSETAPTAARQEIQAILKIFSKILEKARNAADVSEGILTENDLAAAAMSLPFLSQRVETALETGKLAAQAQYRYWAALMAFFAAFMALCAALLLARSFVAKKNGAQPAMAALAKSVANLTKGDMETPIWGRERSDEIGELARSIDLARHFFTQVPDIAMLTEAGPLRLKFEGEQKTLFKLFMDNLSDDYEKARTEIAGLTRTITTQQDLLTALSVRLNSAVNHLQQHGGQSVETLQKLTNSLTTCANDMLEKQQRTAEHVEQLVPYMQDRAQNMAEVTHIAGTKVANALQDFLRMDGHLRSIMADSHEKISSLAGSANSMNERLFAAVNLMQASGNALTETTEATRQRLNISIETLDKGEQRLSHIAELAEKRLADAVSSETNLAVAASRAESSSMRMESAINTMTERHEQFSSEAEQAANRLQEMANSFDLAQRTMLEAVQGLHNDGVQLTETLKGLQENNQSLMQATTDGALAGQAVLKEVSDHAESMRQTLELQAKTLSEQIETRFSLLNEQTGALAQQAEAATTLITQSVSSFRQEQEKFSEMRRNFGVTVEGLSGRLEAQTGASLQRTEAMATQSLERLGGIADHVEIITHRLAVLGQLTGTLGAVAGQLGQIVPSLAKSEGGYEMPDILHGMQDQWQKMFAQLTEMRREMAATLVQQKSVLDKSLTELTAKFNSYATSGLDPAQAALLNEIVSALGLINEHVLHVEESLKRKMLYPVKN